MRVRLLGGLTVEGVAERDLGSRKGRTLLKVLVLARGAPVPVDALVDILWGDDPPARPADQVSVLVSRLRGVLGASRLPRADAGYAVLADWIDVDEVAALGDSAASALADGRVGAARAAADAALALARGPLLPDEDGDWVRAERAAADGAVARARAVAVDAATMAGDHGAAAALAEAGLGHDPYDEALLRASMRAHLAARRPASALAAYARVRRHLAEYLGVSPTAETEELHGQALAAADGDAADDAAPGPVAVQHERRTTLAGRARELAALDAADRQRPGVVVVRGPAGIGKSSLVDTWSAGRHALVGRCDALGRDLALQPVADALARHLRSVGPEAADQILGDEALQLSSLVGGVVPDVPASVGLDAEAGETLLFAALLTAVERATTTLVIEDLHDAGRSTLAWVAFARRRARDLLVVATSRATTDLPPATSIVDLGPLDVDAVAEVVGADRAHEVHARTGGHPLLVAALRDGGDALSDAVDRAVAVLGAHAEITVRAAAVLGEDVDIDLVAGVLERPVVEVLAHLEAAVTAGLLVERGAGFAVRHALVRDALEVGVGGARRALLHRRAAELLVERPQPDALAVAVHAAEGGDRALASRWFAEAATGALARFDAATAEELATRAVDLEPTPEALLGRARVHMALLRLDHAAADAARAVAAGGGARALEVSGWIAYYRRRYGDARAFADEAVATADDAAVRASCLALAGRTRHAVGDIDDAVTRLEESARGSVTARPMATVWLAAARAHQGRPVEALAAMETVPPDVRGVQPFAALHGRFARALALGYVGRVAEAFDAVDGLERLVIEAGPVGARFAGVAANLRSWLLRWSGHASDAEAEVLRGLEITTAAGYGPSRGSLSEPYWAGRLDLADGRLLVGDAGGAAEIAASLVGLDEWHGTMAWRLRHRLGLLRARLALLDGDADSAAAHAAAVRADAAARGSKRYQLFAAALEGTIAGRRADIEALAGVVDALDTCAVLDGWRSVAELADATGVEVWGARAAQRRASISASR